MKLSEMFHCTNCVLRPGLNPQVKPQATLKMFFCPELVYQMISVEDKSWNIFKYEIHEKRISIMSLVYQMKRVEDITWNIFQFPIHE